MTMEISQKVIWGLGVAGVIVVGILFYAFRASDPASRPSIAYKKVDYGAYMQRERQSDRQMPTQPNSPGR